MKKRIKIFNVIIVLVIITTILLVNDYCERYYTMDANVYSVEKNEILFEDETGNLFSILATDTTYKVGERVIIKFDTNNTINNRKDDKIVKVERL